MNTIRSAAEERPPAELAMDYPESLLNKAPAALFRPAIVRLYRAMLNITLNQHDPKYFSLKTDNPIVRDEILACPGGLALLEAVGFQREGEADGLQSSVSDGGGSSEENLLSSSLLTLKMPHDQSLVAAAMARLRLLGQRRVRWLSPDAASAMVQAAAEKGGFGGGVALLPGPLEVGNDAEGNALCVARAPVGCRRRRRRRSNLRQPETEGAESKQSPRDSSCRKSFAATPAV